MKNPLHRKKLQLALNAFTTKVIEKSSELDHIWVTRKTLSTWTTFRFSCSHLNHMYKTKQRTVVCAVETYLN